MDLNLLQVFIELYNFRSLSKAARKLDLSQPSVSRKLQILREHFSDPLFITDGHKLVPTVKAEKLYPDVAKAFNSFQSVLNQSVVRGPKKLTIACSDDFEFFVGPQIVQGFRKVFPEVLVIFRQTNTMLAEKTLQERKADFCITGGGTHSSQVAREGFGLHEDVCLYCGKDGLKRPLSLEEYLEREHVAVHFGGAEGVSDEILRRGNRKRKLVAITTHYSGVERYILGTERIALVPLFFAKILVQTFPSLAYCRIPFNATQDPVELSYRKDLLKEPFYRDCRDVLSEILKTVDWN